jgi:hypothetical protein
MFVAVPVDPDLVGQRRNGEGQFPFTAGAGCASLAMGTVQVPWILRAIRSLVTRDCKFTIDWTAWPPQEGTTTLFCWEAFVVAGAHSDEHVRDAATAAMMFLAHEDDLAAVNGITAELPMSLLHAAGLWSGWSADITRLSKPALVVKPAAPYLGGIVEGGTLIEINGARPLEVEGV